MAQGAENAKMLVDLCSYLSRRSSHWGLVERPHFHFARAGGFSFGTWHEKSTKGAITMALECSVAVWKFSKHRGSHLLLMLALADFANQEGLAWPSVKSLSLRTRMSPRYVQRMLRELEDSGEITTEKRLNTSNAYRINVRARIEKDDDAPPPDLQTAPPVNPSSPPPRSPVHPPPDLQTAPPLTSSSPYPSYEPSKEPSVNRQKPVVQMPIIPLLLMTPEFEAAWADWLSYRKEMKKAVTITTAKHQLAQLEKMGVEKAVGAIRQSISSQWQGLFEPKEQTNGHTPHRLQRTGYGSQGLAPHR